MIQPPESDACPVCAAPVAADVLYAPRPRPVLNNLLYDTLDDALACPAGRIELVQCGTCAFVFNRVFDETLVAYSEDYDSTRSHSPAYLAHLDALVSLIAPRIPRGARVLELGCGDGAFLSRLQTATGAECHGYDINAPEAAGTKRLRFHRGRLDPSGVAAPYDFLFLCHVLEHIAAPYRFLEDLISAGALAETATIFVEVPALDWILDTDTYFDITYEHCNYFLQANIAYLIRSLGFTAMEQHRMFGGQYVVTIGRYGAEAGEGPNPRESGDIVVPGLHAKFHQFEIRRQACLDLINQSDNPSVWGCSGKGVTLLSDLDEGARESIEHVIDTNAAKWNKYLPVSGLKVDPPEVLKNANDPVTIFVMNEAYLQEIRQTLSQMSVEARIAVL